MAIAHTWTNRPTIMNATLLGSSPAIQLLSESFHTSWQCITPARSIAPRGGAHPLAHPPDTHQLRMPLIRGSACQFRRRYVRSPWYRPQSTSVGRRSCSNKDLLPLTLPAAPRKVLVATKAPSAFRWLGPWSRCLLMDPPGSCHQLWIPRGERAQGTWSRVAGLVAAEQADAACDDVRPCPDTSRGGVSYGHIS
jgi:hypothetical protein